MPCTGLLYFTMRTACVYMLGRCMTRTASPSSWRSAGSVTRAGGRTSACLSRCCQRPLLRLRRHWLTPTCASYRVPDALLCRLPCLCTSSCASLSTMYMQMQAVSNGLFLAVMQMRDRFASLHCLKILIHAPPTPPMHLGSHPLARGTRIRHAESV